MDILTVWTLVGFFCRFKLNNFLRCDSIILQRQWGSSYEHLVFFVESKIYDLWTLSLMKGFVENIWIQWVNCLWMVNILWFVAFMLTIISVIYILLAEATVIGIIPLSEVETK